MSDNKLDRIEVKVIIPNWVSSPYGNLFASELSDKEMEQQADKIRGMVSRISADYRFGIEIDKVSTDTPATRDQLQAELTAATERADALQAENARLREFVEWIVSLNWDEPELSNDAVAEIAVDIHNKAGRLLIELRNPTPHASVPETEARYVVIIDEGEPDVGLYTTFHVIDNETNTGLEWFSTEAEAKARADELNANE